MLEVAPNRPPVAAPPNKLVPEEAPNKLAPLEAPNNPPDAPALDWAPNRPPEVGCAVLKRPPGDGAGCDAPNRLGVLLGCAPKRDVPVEGAPNSVPGLGDGAAPNNPLLDAADAPNSPPPAGAAEEAPNSPPPELAGAPNKPPEAGDTNGDACCVAPNILPLFGVQGTVDPCRCGLRPVAKLHLVQFHPWRASLRHSVTDTQSAGLIGKSAPR